MGESHDDRGLLLVISGPSGSGKTTIARAVERRLDGAFSVSATTRPKASGEKSGRDYEFLSEQEFRALIEQGALLEYAQVYGNHWYGTPREPVQRRLDEGRLVILDIDVQGGLQVKRAMPEALLVFVLPPSDEELLRRLRNRGRDDEASVERRLAEAKREIEVGRAAYDAKIINDDLEQAIEELSSLVEKRRGDP